MAADGLERMPTADHVAHAIVAASRETAEDPLDVAGGKRALRARHYAMHALVHCFPDVRRTSVARMCGAAGNPLKFWENSCYQVANPTGTTPARAPWWDDDAYHRVIDALQEAVAPKSVPVLDLRKVGLLPAPIVAPVSIPVVYVPPKRVAAASVPAPQAEKFRLVDQLTPRRKVATRFVDVTAEFLGDPEPGRFDHQRRGT